MLGIATGGEKHSRRRANCWKIGRRRAEGLGITRAWRGLTRASCLDGTCCKAGGACCSARVYGKTRACCLRLVFCPIREFSTNIASYLTRAYISARACDRNWIWDLARACCLVRDYES